MFVRPLIWFVGLLGFLGLSSGVDLRTMHSAQGADDFQKSPFVLPEGRWTKLAPPSPDLLGREIDPGRGAFWKYVPAEGAFLRFGGYTPTESNALWSFDLATRSWKCPLPDDYSWPPTEDRPPAGAWWSMALDTKRNVIWMFGGVGTTRFNRPELVDDIWQYDLKTKTFKRMESKQCPRGSASIVYDAANDLVVRAPAYGGEWDYRHNQDATWVYDPNSNAWQARKTKGAPGHALAPIWVYEPNSQRIVYLSNRKEGGAATWTYDAKANAWEEIKVETNPPGRICAGAAYVPELKSVVIHGGVGGPTKPGDYGYLHRGGGVRLLDTWRLDLAAKKWEKLSVGEPETHVFTAGSRGKRTIFETATSFEYDSKLKTLVLCTVNEGVWALRIPSEGKSLPEIKIAALPEPEPAKKLAGPVFPSAPLNKRLLELEPNAWVPLNGGKNGLCGTEVPHIYDEATGFILSFGGCGNGGSTFASGYGNDLRAFDPATERWIALRWTDPCAPARPGNGCTRYYAYDPGEKSVWFAGGTAGNHLESRLPANWPVEELGTWRYLGLEDRFEYVPTQGKPGTGAGVATIFDRDHRLFVAMPKAYADFTQGFDPKKRAWRTLSKENHAQHYTYGCYADSIKSMIVVGKVGTGKNDPKDAPLTTWAFNAATGEWSDWGRKGLPDDVKFDRPATAYDPKADKVLLVMNDRMFALDVKSKTWSEVAVQGKMPKIREALTFDRRHNVFIGGDSSRGTMYALRLGE